MPRLIEKADAGGRRRPVTARKYIMSRSSEAKETRMRERAAREAAEVLALPHVIDEATAGVPVKAGPQQGLAHPDADEQSKRAEDKAYARQVHGAHLTATVYRDQVRGVVNGPMYEETAVDYAADFVERVAPRNVLEEVLARQLLWSETRTAHLSIRACREASPQRIRTFNQAADAASNTTRKLALALVECRRPRRGGDTYIRQANVAGQQVVQNQQPGGAGDATK